MYMYQLQKQLREFLAYLIGASTSSAISSASEYKMYMWIFVFAEQFNDRLKVQLHASNTVKTLRKAKSTSNLKFSYFDFSYSGFTQI